MGWGGIIINVVVALKGVTRCGCFEDPCSTSRARCVGVGWEVGRGGIMRHVGHVVVVLKIHVARDARAVWVWGGGAGWGGIIINVSCIEGCNTLWLF